MSKTMTTDELRAKRAAAHKDGQNVRHDDRWRYARAGASDAFRECLPIAEERDRLLRLLAVERGDESQAPEGWRRPAGRWIGPCGASVVRGYAPGGGQAWAAFGWDGAVLGWHPTALEAMEAADAARE